MYLKILQLVLFSLLSFHVFGQQNLFNVPSSDITPKAKPFFQQQFTIEAAVVQLNSTFSFGLGKNMEVGVNLVGVNVNTTSAGSLIQTNTNSGNNPVFPFYLINFQKAFELSELSRTGLPLANWFMFLPN